jgi:hypothetical protein
LIRYRLAGAPQVSIFRETGDIYSQCGEATIVRRILNRIGATNKVCLEVGASDGTHLSNTRSFGEQGWTRILIEADRRIYMTMLLQLLPNDKPLNCEIEPDGVNSLDTICKMLDVPRDIDFLSLDIDGDDYWIFKAIKWIRPRIVCMEFAVGSEGAFRPARIGSGQAPYHYVYDILKSKGQSPIVATRYNLISVRRDIAKEYPGLHDMLMQPEQQTEKKQGE